MSDIYRLNDVKRLKHILLATALLAALLPGAHALEHHGHEHDSALELCALDALPCECHSCDHQPCSADVEIQLDRTVASVSLEVPLPAAIRLSLPEYKPTLRNTTPRVSGILASIQTVQLLI